MNLPNRLTLSRIIMIPFFVVFLLWGHWGAGIAFSMAGKYLALLIFVGAATTDWLDGVIPRRHKLISNFGKLMDPLADKLIVASAFIVFVELHLFPGWVVVLIL